jgi:hypothetical protein
MATVTFDTMQYVDTLTAAGVPEAQAKAMAKAQATALEQTSKDIDYVSRNDLKTDIGELRGDMHQLESGLRRDMSEMKAEIFKAMLVQTFAIAGLVAGIMAVVLKLFLTH